MKEVALHPPGMNKDRRGFAIPVLMYHHVNPEGNFINARPDLFENHLRELRDSGYSTVDCKQLSGLFCGDTSFPDKPVMITFDDGWLDNWVYAFPILKKYNMKAVIFVVTSHVTDDGIRLRSDQGEVSPLPVHRECQAMLDSGRGREVMMSWSELAEMERSGLVDIQSHTHTHKRWDIMYPDTEERLEVVREELKTSKVIIENRLNKKCIAICWPWGVYDDDYIKAAVDSGYELMFTTEKGTNTQSSDPQRIRRLVVGNISTFAFRKKLFIHSREWLSRLYLKYF